MKNNQRTTKTLVLALLAAVVGGSLHGESMTGFTMGAGLQRRLLLKAAETLIDASTRKVVDAATASGPREDYELRGRCGYYDDLVAGMYRGIPMVPTYRRMWLDPVTGSQFFGTWTNRGFETDRPFYYVEHNRRYRCTESEAPGFSLSIEANAFYWLEHLVVRLNPDHSVGSHPIRWHFTMRSLPAGCTDPTPPGPREEMGHTTLVRGGRESRSPLYSNVDITACVVTYDEK